MKSEQQFYEELSVPCQYEDAVNDVHGLKIKAVKAGIYFKTPIYEHVSPSGMKLRIDGHDLPLLTKSGIIDAINRLGDNVKNITDEKEILSTIRNLRDRQMATYWYVLYKFAERTFIIQAGNYINIFAVLGATGISHSVSNPVYTPPSETSETSNDDDDDDDDDDDY